MKLNLDRKLHSVTETKQAIVHFDLHWTGSHDSGKAVKAVTKIYPSTSVRRNKFTFLGAISFSLPSTTFTIDNIGEGVSQTALGNHIVNLMEAAGCKVDKLTVDFIAPGGFVHNGVLDDWFTRNSLMPFPLGTYLPGFLAFSGKR